MKFTPRLGASIHCLAGIAAFALAGSALAQPPGWVFRHCLDQPQQQFARPGLPPQGEFQHLSLTSRRRMEQARPGLVAGAAGRLRGAECAAAVPARR